jgi:hypothetical protein
MRADGADFYVRNELAGNVLFKGHVDEAVFSAVLIMNMERFGVLTHGFTRLTGKPARH